MSLTAEALKKLGSEAAEGAVKEAKGWDAVSSSAYEALGSVNKKDVSELKNFKHPPVAIIELSKAVAICLGEPARDWKEGKKIIGDMKFLQRVKDFDPSTINAKMLKELKPLVGQTDIFNVENMGKTCGAAKCFCMWVLAVYEYGSDQAL